MSHGSCLLLGKYNVIVNLKHTVFAKTILQKREFFFSFLFSFEMVRRDDGLIEVCVHPKITIKLC